MSDFETNDAPSVHNEANDALDREADAILASFSSRAGSQQAGDTEQGDAVEPSDAPQDGAPVADAGEQGKALASDAQESQPDATDVPAPLEVLGANDAAMPVSASDQESVPAEEAHRKRRRWPTIVLALLVLALGAYLAGVVAFMKVFLPNTTLNGDDVSLKTIEDVARANSDSISSFQVVVTGDGVDLTLGASDIKATYDGGAFARAAIGNQHPWRWPLEVMGTHQIEVETRLAYDAVRLDDQVGSAVDKANKDVKDPEDAKISYNDESKRYEVVPEVLGTRIDRKAAIKAVRDAITAGQHEVELGDEQLVKPQVLSTDEAYNKAVDSANAALEATQTLKRGDDTLATVEAEDLQKWVKLEKDLTVSFDLDACTKWARGELSERLDTIGSKRTFNLPDGRQVSVSGGTYGWSINGGEIAEKIAENVKAGKQADIEVTWLATANSWNPGGNEWGDTYIEIDLGKQHVRYFKDGKVALECDCVSGGLNSGKMHYTPTGVYYINSNMQSGDVELKGEIDPVTKKPEYISHVKYWMPFIDNSHALHDADWRSSFGGNIYQSNGSHGCVNLPPSKAAELYGMVSVGTVVVVHD